MAETPNPTLQRALKILSPRDHSISELRRKLLDAGEPTDEVEAALESLQRHGLLDDAKYSRLVADEASHGGRGADWVKGRLEKAEIADHIIEEIVAGLPSEWDRALEAAQKRAKALGSLEPAVALRRLVGWLQRRGFPTDMALEAAREALGASDVEEAFPG